MHRVGVVQNLVNDQHDSLVRLAASVSVPAGIVGSAPEKRPQIVYISRQHFRPGRGASSARIRLDRITICARLAKHPDNVVALPCWRRADTAIAGVAAERLVWHSRRAAFVVIEPPAGQAGDAWDDPMATKPCKAASMRKAEACFWLSSADRSTLEGWVCERAR
jgi:hypothetical protein